jgi:hypothetical protein
MTAYTAQVENTGDARLASIEHALETGKGLPMTLAIICHSILRRAHTSMLTFYQIWIAERARP